MMPGCNDLEDGFECGLMIADADLEKVDRGEGEIVSRDEGEPKDCERRIRICGEGVRYIVRCPIFGETKW